MNYPRVPFVPLPMAMFGAVVAFMFGATVGVTICRKRDMMMHGGMHHQKHWMQPGMRSHHHHGEGAPACREWHGEAPSPESPTQPDSSAD
jgi:hypothetical protein